MSNYRRLYQPGGTYFFTLVSYQRKAIFTTPENISSLRTAFRSILQRHPCKLTDIAVLPDHLHFILVLPEGDTNFSLRIRLIKRLFSAAVSAAANHRGEKSVWQRRFWEHLIRDENDLQRHMDYIYYNPVRHGLVASPADWPFSSFARAVRQRLYDVSWGRQEPGTITGMDCE